MHSCLATHSMCALHDAGSRGRRCVDRNPSVPAAFSKWRSKLTHPRSNSQRVQQNRVWFAVHGEDTLRSMAREERRRFSPFSRRLKPDLELLKHLHGSFAHPPQLVDGSRRKLVFSLSPWSASEATWSVYHKRTPRVRDWTRLKWTCAGMKRVTPALTTRSQTLTMTPCNHRKLFAAELVGETRLRAEYKAPLPSSPQKGFGQPIRPVRASRAKGSIARLLIGAD